jgi:hypothetical protein
MGALAAGGSGWWGFAEADPTIVGVLVGAIVILAIAYVADRVRSKR